MKVNIEKQRIKQKKYKMTKNQWQLLSMCIIPVISVFIFCYLPMGGIVIAFKNYKFDLGIWGSEWVGFENFIYFFKGQDFWRVTRNTIVLNFMFIGIGLICELIFAVLLYELRSRRGVKIYQTIAITPHFISWVVVGSISYAFLHPQSGMINKIVEMFGGTAVDWYSQPDAWPVILLIFSIWKHIGMNSVIYYAAMMSIDSSLFEAAEIDGASKLQRSLYVTIPSIVPMIIIMVILKIGNIFRADFGLFYQLTRDVGALYPTTDVLDTYIYRVMRVFGDMSTSSAMGMLQSVVGLCCVLITNFVVKKIDPDRALF